MTKNQVAKVEKEAHALLVPEATEAWGAENVESSDIRIPKMLLMQGLSQFVSDAKAEAGDIVDSITAEVLGCAKKMKEPAKDIRVIPITMWKNWVKKEEINGKFEYKETIAYDSSTANLPREEVVGGVKVQNNLTYNVMVMREEEAKVFGAFPHVISFSRMTINCGKDLFTLAQKAKMINKPVAAFTVSLGAEMIKNDKGSFYVFKVNGTEPTKDLNEVAPNLKMWYDTFSAGKATVDNSDLVSEATSAEPEFVPF